MAFTLKKVLISDEIDQKCVDILQKNGIEVDKNTKLSKEQLITEIGKYDGLIVRSATKVTAEVIEAGSNLKIIGRAGTGVDNIDCKAATRKGVIVMNTPGGNTLSAAEHTCTLLLAMSRHISNGTQSLREGLWERKKYMGNEVYGKTLGIIGLGRIGKEVATRMQSFGMKTIGYDPIIPGSVSATFDVEWMELEKLWPQVDYVTVHTPLIPQTKNLINDDVFSKCKKGIRVINCARGGIIDEDALLRALDSGKCGGAGLDVFCDEPPKDSPLVKHPLVTCTPHLGASTQEAQTRVAEEIAQQFVDLSTGKTLFGAINAAAMTDALSPDTKPWVELGSGLGKVMTMLAGGVHKECAVVLKTQGESLKSASYLEAAVLMGLLASQSQDTLNLVNAPALAKELGIKVNKQHDDSAPADYPALVTLSVRQPMMGFIPISGTVGAGQPLLTKIENSDFPSAVRLQGNVLLYRSKPEKFMAIAGALTDAKVEIQAYQPSSVQEGFIWGAIRVAAPVSDSVRETLTSQCDTLDNLSF